MRLRRRYKVERKITTRSGDFWLYSGTRGLHRFLTIAGWRGKNLNQLFPKGEVPIRDWVRII